MPPAADNYDVVIIGGAFSGAVTALLLRRQNPALRVLIVEKLEAFDGKVGEATVEMSAMFLTRVLGLWQHLELNHLPKEGLRYWSANANVTSHANASETGGFLRSTVPSFQLRRDLLDEHILGLAVKAGVELLRPARVRNIELKDYDNATTINWKDAEGAEHTRVVHSKWLVDASGRACFIGKHLGLIDWNDEHPIAAIWARWNNVRHIDDLCAQAGTERSATNIGSRRLATNHYIGRGFWVWVIPLGGGQTSIGLVFDKRFHKLHEATDRRATFEAFLRRHPALAELLEGATLDPEDLRGLSRVAYATRQYMGSGWALVGDAAAFIDPYYSPGLDHACFSSHSTARLILQHAAGGDGAAFTKQMALHNDKFLRSYRWFFRCAYRDKYFIFGEHDLTTASFLIDTAFYYVFLVVRGYRVIKRFEDDPVYAPAASWPFYLMMRVMKWRFRRIAALREQAGEAGLRNDNRRTRVFFNLGLAPFHMCLRGMKIWAFAEIDAVRLRLKILVRRADAPRGVVASATIPVSASSSVT